MKYLIQSNATHTGLYKVKQIKMCDKIKISNRPYLFYTKIFYNYK